MGQPLIYDKAAQEGDGRRLHRHAHRRGIRAARRARRALGLCVRQHLAAVSLRYRRALRSGDRQGRSRQELLLSALPHGRDDVLRGQGVQPVHGRARRRRWRSTISTATISITAGLGFFGGCRFACGHGDGRPIGYRPMPPGTPRWGAAWKTATAKWYSHAANIAVSGSNYANRNNYLDLDPTYKDQLGRPLLRLTYNFVENDYKVMEYTLGVAAKIARAMNPTIMGEPRMRRGRLRHRPLPIDAQHRRHDHGNRPEDQRGQPLSAIVGRRQSVHHGRFDVPAATGLQPDRTGRSPCLLVRRGDRHQVSQEPGPLVHAG